MVADHVGSAFFPQYPVFRWLGRLAFPFLLLPELSAGCVGQSRRPAGSCDRQPYGGLDDFLPAGGPADFLAYPHRRQDQQMVLLHFLPRPSGPHRPGEIFGFDCIKERE